MSEIEKAIDMIRIIAEFHDFEDSETSHEFSEYFPLMVESLREKQEREKGCEYCDFSSGAVGATFDGEDDFFMIEHADGVNLCSDGKEFTLTKIKFCPMCGRKIGENDGGQTSN